MTRTRCVAQVNKNSIKLVSHIRERLGVGGAFRIGRQCFEIEQLGIGHEVRQLASLRKVKTLQVNNQYVRRASYRILFGGTGLFLASFFIIRLKMKTQFIRTKT